MSSAFVPPLLSCGDPPDLFVFSLDLLAEGDLVVCLDDAGALKALDDDDALLGLSALCSSLSASSIGGPGLFTDSGLATLVTCENDPSWLLWTPLLSILSFWLESITAGTALLSNENVSLELINFDLYCKLSARICRRLNTADNLRIALNLLN